MSEFISTIDAKESGDFTAQKTVRDEVADISYRFRREMDQGLTSEDMVKAKAAKEAADAASDILSKYF